MLPIEYLVQGGLGYRVRDKMNNAVLVGDNVPKSRSDQALNVLRLRPGSPDL